MQRLQQVRREPAQQGVFLEGIDHPHHREPTHQKGAEEIAIQGHTIQPQP
jgi:hypothetical protein